MVRIETFSIDDYCYDVLSREKNKSKFVREAIKAYFSVDILISLSMDSLIPIKVITFNIH